MAIIVGGFFVDSGDNKSNAIVQQNRRIQREFGWSMAKIRRSIVKLFVRECFIDTENCNQKNVSCIFAPVNIFAYKTALLVNHICYFSCD